MDHKDQHHEHHRHEREEKKKEQKEHERKNLESRLPIHPMWLAAVGVAAVVAAVLIWTFLLS